MTAGSALIDRRYSSQENRYVLMLRLPKFRYFQPETLSEAVEMMADGGPEAMFVAGGTDLYPNMKRRQQMPKIVIGLAQLQELRTIKGKPKEEMVLGAGLTLSEVGVLHAEGCALGGPQRRADPRDLAAGAQSATTIGAVANSATTTRRACAVQESPKRAIA